jgi:uracil-DNA glycosylase family 4
VRRIGGEGPTPCDLLFLGEYPGVEEMKYGRPFVGRAGRELGRWFNGYTLPARQDVRLSNLRRTPLPGKTWVLDDEDHQDLYIEVAETSPTVIVALGAHVVQYFLGDVTLEAVHGIPHPARHDAYTGLTIFPSYNPAAALHSPGLQSVFAYDMRRLSLYLAGRLPLAFEDLAPQVYRLGGDLMLLEDPAVDTEGLPGRNWGASWSQTDGYGYVVRAGEEFQQFANGIRLMRAGRANLRLTLHNALHDLRVLREMGLDLDTLDIAYDDTMVMAYLLGLEPQGLKPLAYRHCGALHTDYSDVVAEPSGRIAEEWLATLAASPAVPDKVRKLMLAMLAKGKPETLRKRWAECRSREIIVEELELLPHDEGDPPEATLDDVPLQVAVNYAGRDADLTRRIRPYLRTQLHAYDLDDVYETDLRIIPMVDRMQAVGLEVDIPHYQTLVELFTVEEAINAEAITKVVGHPLNPRSGDQVAHILFDDLKLHEKYPNLRIKRTKGGEKKAPRLTTNDKVLEALELAHPLVKLIQEGREINKMRGTYAEAILRLVGRDGRLHPRFRLTRTDTGRLSAADPNVLALPKHSARGKLIRMGLRAGVGHVLSEWDLTQIEMVTFACDAMDEVMLDAFRRGLDFHTNTAAPWYGKTYDQLQREYLAFKAGNDAYEAADHERFTAKAVNFGILMGMTPFGLLDQLHKEGLLETTLLDTEQRLQQWHATYPQGSRYIDRKHAEARQFGFVRDRWGRMRWLEGIHSPDKYIAAEAERMAQSTPTQSGAQGIIKRAMGALWPVLVEMRKAGIWVECLLQVHDALVLEHEPEYTALIDAAVMNALCHTVRLPIPISAKAKTGVQRLGEL